MNKVGWASKKRRELASASATKKVIAKKSRGKAKKRRR
jgi:hypothetical protein